MAPLRIEVPRDRDGSFEPQLIPKHERRFTGFDDKIIAMYARGMTVREIQGFLAEHVRRRGLARLHQHGHRRGHGRGHAPGRSRPLEPMYPVVFFDALRVKIREDAVVRNKAIYLALGVLPDGTRDILGLWIEKTEGAKFWMKVFNDLKTRGVDDILIAVTDGLKGMPEALAAVFPATTLQTCIVHLIRNSLDYASWKDRKALAAAIKPIYTARQRRGRRRPNWTPSRQGRGARSSRPSWRPGGGPGTSVIPFFAFPPEVRRVIYTTNAIESVQRAAAQDHQDPRALPERRRGHQADLAGAAQHHRRLGPGSQRLEGGDEPVRDPLRRPLHEIEHVRSAISFTKSVKVQRASHTEIRTHPLSLGLGQFLRVHGLPDLESWQRTIRPRPSHHRDRSESILC